MGVNALALEHGLSGAYPLTWDDFIGQAQAKRQLQIAAASAKQRGQAMAHVLLASGTPGIGKTALALLTATELDTAVKIVAGRMNQNEARIALSSMDDGDVLFIDEIHQLVSRGKANAEWMLHLLQDGVLIGPFGPEEQPRITIIGATTDLGRLPDTIISRFGLRPIIKPYTEDEAVLIASKMAGQILVNPLPWPRSASFREIARAGSHNPRTIGAILSNLRDIALIDEGIYDFETGAYDLTEALEWLGLSADGLTEQQRTYLKVLIAEFNGQAGEKSLADRLGEPGGIGHVERPLIERGLIVRTRQGRMLTKDGIDRAKKET